MNRANFEAHKEMVNAMKRLPMDSEQQHVAYMGAMCTYLANIADSLSHLEKLLADKEGDKCKETDTSNSSTT